MATQVLSSGLASASSSEEGYQACWNTTLVPPSARCAQTDVFRDYAFLALTKGNITQDQTWRREIPVRIPVVDTRGVALMPCTPATARHLFKGGKARPKRNKLGLFYVQLTYE